MELTTSTRYTPEDDPSQEGWRRTTWHTGARWRAGQQRRCVPDRVSIGHAGVPPGKHHHERARRGAGIPGRRRRPCGLNWHGPFNSLAASPDGRRLAIGVGLASGTLGIWIKQLDRGPFTRLTFGGQDRRPLWSPDGQTVAFVRDSLNFSSIFERRADGSTPDRQLAWLDRQVQEVSWSADGRWLLLRTDNGAPGAGDIVGVPTSGDTTPVSLVSSPFTS